MSIAIELVPYTPDLLHPTAQLIQEILSLPAYDEALGLSDVLARHQSDMTREGFGALLLRAGRQYVGGSIWYGITGRDLSDRWRPRFTPRDAIPNLTGRGVWIALLAVLPRWQRRGLGSMLMNATLDQVQPDHDWIAVNTLSDERAVRLFAREGFAALPVASVIGKARLCLLKQVTAPVA